MEWEAARSALACAVVNTEFTNASPAGRAGMINTLFDGELCRT